jgi:hypothetical protein
MVQTLIKRPIVKNTIYNTYETWGEGLGGNAHAYSQKRNAHFLGCLKVRIFDYARLSPAPELLIRLPGRFLWLSVPDEVLCGAARQFSRAISREVDAQKQGLIGTYAPRKDTTIKWPFKSYSSHLSHNPPTTFQLHFFPQFETVNFMAVTSGPLLTPRPPQDSPTF